MFLECVVPFRHTGLWNGSKYIKTSEVKMDQSGGWLGFCLLGIFSASCQCIKPCPNGITISVILLQDEESPWSLNFVQGEILKAIETDTAINDAQGNTKLNVKCLHAMYRQNCGAYYNIVVR